MKKQEQNITKNELVILAKKMALSFYLEESKLIIRSTFNILNKSNFGLLLLFLLGVFSTSITLIYGEGIKEWALGLPVGLIFLFAGGGTILKQCSDFLEVNDTHLIFRHRFKKRKIEITNGLKVKMEPTTDYVDLRGVSGSGSYWRAIEILMIQNQKEFVILDFQTESKNSRDANLLAEEICRFIRSRIKMNDKLKKLKHSPLPKSEARV
jgi:hypothetical protein